MSKKKSKKMTITKKLCEESRPFFSKYENNVTRSAFVKNYRKFIEFCRSEHNCKTTEECKNQLVAVLTKINLCYIMKLI